MSSERAIQGACARGEIENAATLALEAYGGELLGYLIARLGEQQGNEVFSEVLEDFWRGLPAFEWRCSLRSWLYTIARHAMARLARGRQRRAEVPIEASPAVAALAARIRTATAAHLRTAVKTRLRELRTQLSDDEQTLLMLRIDRNFSWRELAVVMSEAEAPREDAELDKFSARLRQRFQTAKERLRKLAEAEGLVAEHEGEAAR